MPTAIVAAALASVGAALCALAGTSSTDAVVLATLSGMVGALLGAVAVMRIDARAHRVVEGAIDALCENGALPDDLPSGPGLERLRELAAIQARQAAAEAELRQELEQVGFRHLRERARLLHDLELAGGAGGTATDAFLMRMSHELRTPLNAILGYAEILTEELGDADELRSDAERIRQSGRHLLGLVTAVLDLTQMQAGRHEVEPEPIDFKALVEQVVDGVRPVAAANDDTIDVTLELKREAVLDRRMVQAILFNLVHNAAKYTKRGMVTVRVTVDDACEIFVGDTGIGMTARQLEAAFVPFGQADASTTRAYDGTGLGLAVCRGFAEAMGGHVHVDTALGEGARITVTLPRRAAAVEWTDELFEEEKTRIMR